MAKRIIWSKSAIENKIQIFTYWNHRNQSKLYSKKLNQQFNAIVQLIQEFPEMGMKTDLGNIRKIMVDHYAIYYENLEHEIAILAIWDGRQNPENLDVVSTP
ncbi:MAG: type II toxin-antitoxin system RelE/ParE family toxin [Chitinophagaceae bacterium]